MTFMMMRIATEEMSSFLCGIGFMSVHCALCIARACVRGETVTLELGDRSIYTSLKLYSPLPVRYKQN